MKLIIYIIRVICGICVTCLIPSGVLSGFLLPVATSVRTDVLDSAIYLQLTQVILRLFNSIRPLSAHYLITDTPAISACFILLINSNTLLKCINSRYPMLPLSQSLAIFFFKVSRDTISTSDSNEEI